MTDFDGASAVSRSRGAETADEARSRERSLPVSAFDSAGYGHNLVRSVRDRTQQEIKRTSDEITRSLDQIEFNRAADEACSSVNASWRPSRGETAAHEGFKVVGGRSACPSPPIVRSAQKPSAPRAMPWAASRFGHAVGRRVRDPLTEYHHGDGRMHGTGGQACGETGSRNFGRCSRSRGQHVHGVRNAPRPRRTRPPAARRCLSMLDDRPPRRSNSSPTSGCLARETATSPPDARMPVPRVVPAPPRARLRAAL